MDAARAELKGDIAKANDIAANTDRNVVYILGVLRSHSLQEVETAVQREPQPQEAVGD